MMITRCPACQTVFRLRPEQLHARGGEVRCGHCFHPFNALENTVEVRDEGGAAAPPPPPRAATTEAGYGPTVVNTASTPAAPATIARWALCDQPVTVPSRHR